MQYIATTQAKPLKIEDDIFPEPLTLSKEGNVIITEKRKIHLSKTEFLKSIKALNDKLGYLRYQISEDNIIKIKQQINDLLKKKDLFEKFLDKLKKQ